MLTGGFCSLIVIPIHQQKVFDPRRWGSSVAPTDGGSSPSSNHSRYEGFFGGPLSESDSEDGINAFRSFGGSTAAVKSILRKVRDRLLDAAGY